MKFIKVILTFVVSLACITITWAGGWTRSKGEGYFQLGISGIYSDKLHSRFGSSIQLRRSVSDITIQNYLEYGLSQNITLKALLPFKLLKTGDEIYSTPHFSDTLPQGGLNNFGNINTSVLFSLAKRKSWVFSFEQKVEAKSAVFDPETGLRTGYSAWGFAPSLHIGYGNSQIYFTSEAGGIYRTNGYSDLLKFSIEGGYNILEKLYIIAGIDIRKSLYNGRFDDGNALHTGMYINNQEYLAYNAKLSYMINEKLGATLIASGGSPANGVPVGLFYMAAVYYKWNRK